MRLWEGGGGELSVPENVVIKQDTPALAVAEAADQIPHSLQDRLTVSTITHQYVRAFVAPKCMEGCLH